MTAQPGIGADEVDRLAGECWPARLLVTRARTPLPATVILSEALVRCPVGGADVMAEQLRHLAGLAALPNVRLRVIPVSAGMHPGVITGPFTLLRFPLNGDGKETDPDTVCLSGLSGELYLDESGRGAALPRCARGHARRCTGSGRLAGPAADGGQGTPAVTSRCVTSGVDDRGSDSLGR